VIALACLRGLTQERGVFLRTPKFRGAAAIREIRLVWVETLIATTGGLLIVAVTLEAGFSVVGLTLAALLAWSTLIYASATSYALGDPTRAPVGASLRAKARLEIAPRVGRLTASRPARAGAVGAGLLAIILLSVAILESGRPPVAALPFNEVPGGPIGALGNRPTPAPTSLTSPSSSNEPSATPTPTSAGTTATPLPSGGGTPRPTGPPATTPPATPVPPPAATPTPLATPTPRPSPPVPIPTPTAHPTPLPSPGRTPPPHPTPSPPVP